MSSTSRSSSLVRPPRNPPRPRLRAGSHREHARVDLHPCRYADRRHITDERRRDVRRRPVPTGEHDKARVPSAESLGGVARVLARRPAGTHRPHHHRPEAALRATSSPISPGNVPIRSRPRGRRALRGPPLSSAAAGMAPRARARSTTSTPSDPLRPTRPPIPASGLTIRPIRRSRLRGAKVPVSLLPDPPCERHFGQALVVMDLTPDDAAVRCGLHDIGRAVSLLGDLVEGSDEAVQVLPGLPSVGSGVTGSSMIRRT